MPPWLAPVQVVGIPIGDAHVPYLMDAAALLGGRGIRVEVDDSADRMQKKIRNAQKRKFRLCCSPGTTTLRRARFPSATVAGAAQRRTVAAAVDEIVAAVESRAQV